MKKKLKKQKSSTKKQKENVKANTKKMGRIAPISKALPFHFDSENQLFITNKQEYIKMLRIQGINLYGMKQNDQELRMLKLQEIFSNLIGHGQIYSYEIPAKVDDYISDYEVMKNRIDLRDPLERIKNEILIEGEEILLNAAVTRNLIDRVFILILKDKNLQRLNQKVQNAYSIMSAFNYTYELSLQEMSEIIYSYYNPRNSIVLKDMYNISEDIMDYIYPDQIGYVDKNFEQYINVNGVYTSILYVSKFKTTELGFLSTLATYEDVEFSLHFEPAPKNEVREQLDKSLRNTSKNIEKLKEGSEKQEQIDKERNLLELIDQVQVDGDIPMYFSVAIRLKADTKEQLIEYEKLVKNDLVHLGFKVRSGIFQSLELFNLCAPICTNDTPIYMKQTTSDTLGWSYPFVFETLYDSVEKYDKNNNYICNYPPLYLGNTTTTGGAVFYDNFTKKEDRANYNEFIEGITGFGKTTLIMYFIKFRHALGCMQYILDVEGRELNKLTYALGGEIINCANGENGRINPMQVRIIVPDDPKMMDKKIPLDHIKPLSSHIRYLRSFFRSYRGDSDEIGILHDSKIEDALTDVYADYGITKETTGQEIVDRSNEDFPTFLDLYEKLIAYKNEEEGKEYTDRNIIKILNECIAFIKPLAIGADAEVFNGTTNINLNNKLYCFDFSGLHDNTASEILGTQYLNVLSYIWSQVASNENIRTQIYEDELSIIQNPKYKEIMIMNEDMIRRVRKYLCGMTFATQQLLDMLKPSIEEHTRVILTQPTYHFYFNTDTESLAYLEEHNILPASELDWLKSCKIGQCFAKFGNQTSMRLNIELSEKTLAEFEEIKR